VVSGDEEFMTDSSVAARADAAPTNDVGGIAADRLRSFVERLERLEEEKKGISDDIKDVYLEAKGTGFEPPTFLYPSSKIKELAQYAVAEFVVRPKLCISTLQSITL
jgi:hypothetical protein